MALAPPVERVSTPRRAGRARSWRLGLPFVLVHIAVLGVFIVGWSPAAIIVAVLSYTTRAFGITAFYHRCFAHRSYRVPRAVGFGGAVLGAAAAQQGPLWWVAHHRAHHRYTDRPGDPHSPVVDGFWRSHLLWIFDPANASPDMERVKDLARFRELRILDRFDHLVPVSLALATTALGVVLALVTPGLHTSGPQMFVWGFAVPTVLLYHSTFAVNSVAHRFGRRRFDTPDASRNQWVVACLTLGEGWHNNHHRFPTSARMGIGWLELDPTWWGIMALSGLGLASGVRRMPARVASARDPAGADGGS